MRLCDPAVVHPHFDAGQPLVEGQLQIATDSKSKYNSACFESQKKIVF
jgi:hypothetical protein